MALEPRIRARSGSPRACRHPPATRHHAGHGAFGSVDQAQSASRQMRAPASWSPRRPMPAEPASTSSSRWAGRSTPGVTLGEGLGRQLVRACSSGRALAFLPGLRPVSASMRWAISSTGRSPPTGQQPLLTRAASAVLVLPTTSTSLPCSSPRAAPAKASGWVGCRGENIIGRASSSAAASGCQPSRQCEDDQVLEQRGAPGKQSPPGGLGKVSVPGFSPGAASCLRYLLKGFHRLAHPAPGAAARNTMAGTEWMPCAWICCSAAATSSANCPLSSTSRTALASSPRPSPRPATPRGGTRRALAEVGLQQRPFSRCWLPSALRPAQCSSRCASRVFTMRVRAGEKSNPSAAPRCRSMSCTWSNCAGPPPYLRCSARAGPRPRAPSAGSAQRGGSAGRAAPQGTRGDRQQGYAGPRRTRGETMSETEVDASGRV